MKKVKASDIVAGDQLAHDDGAKFWIAREDAVQQEDGSVIFMADHMPDGTLSMQHYADANYRVNVARE